MACNNHNNVDSVEARGYYEDDDDDDVIVVDDIVGNYGSDSNLSKCVIDHIDPDTNFLKDFYFDSNICQLNDSVANIKPHQFQFFN